MFTGIIHHWGFFRGYRLGKQEMAVEAPTLFVQIAVEESLAVNGVCLSLVAKEKNVLRFNLSLETLQKTTLGSLRSGARLNLELPLTMATPLSGHLVTGHIDFQGKVLRITAKRPGKRIAISFPKEYSAYFIPKGSVAVNGVSLTIASLGPSAFEVELIPITLEKTNLGELRSGENVNIECDIIGKYVYNWMSQGNR
ncbi:MAG: riboflavin synthase [Candidatus Aminicenantales bacterium]